MNIRLSRLALLPSLLWNALLLGAPQSSFPLFDGKVWVPVGNHGSTTAEITGPSELTTTDGYGPHKEVLRYDWTRGTLVRTDFDSHPEPTVVESSFPAPAEGGAYLPYRRQLSEMISHLVWIQQHLYYLDKAEEKKRSPEMQAVLNYLKAELARLDEKAEDAIDVSNVPLSFRKGASHKIAVETLTKQKRDLIVRLLDASGQELKIWRSELKVGLETSDFSVDVPDSVPVDSTGILLLSLVPVGADFDQALATHKTQIQFTRTEQILNANAYWVSYLEKPAVSLYASYYCPNACELRADIYSADGQRLVGTTLKADPPLVKDGIQYSSFDIEANDAFQEGVSYTFIIKLIPTGGTEEQAFTQIKGQFTVGT